MSEQFLNGTSAISVPLHGIKIKKEIYLTMIRKKVKSEARVCVRVNNMPKAVA